MFRTEKKDQTIFLMTDSNRVLGFGIDRLDTLKYYKQHDLGFKLRTRLVSRSYIGHLVNTNVQLMRL